MTRTVFIGAHVPPEMADALSRAATRADRSLSAELRRAIRRYLSCDKEPQEDGGANAAA